MALKALVTYTDLGLKAENVALQNVTQFTQLAAANILLDPYTLNLYFLEGYSLYEADGSTRRGLITLSENFTYSLSTSAAEAFEVTEAVAKGFTMGTVAETVSLRVCPPASSSSSRYPSALNPSLSGFMAFINMGVIDAGPDISMPGVRNSSGIGSMVQFPVLMCVTGSDRTEYPFRWTSSSFFTRLSLS